MAKARTGVCGRTISSRARASFTPHWPSVSLLAIFLLSGCAGGPERQAEGPIFYPPLPNPPRIQYLATFSQPIDAGDAPSTFGQFIFGDEAEEEFGVRKPYGAALFEGKLYVVDTRGSGYAIFDLANKRFRFVVGAGASDMKKPINITIDRDGTKYVTDTEREQVLAFDRDDHFLRAYGVTGQFKPSDVAIAGDKLYVADLRNHEIQVLDKHSGELRFRFGSAGSNEGQLLYPTNLALGPDEHLYVSDTGNFRIQKFTLDGQFVRSFGSIGTGLGHFARPKGVALDREGRMYVVDAAFQNVQVFDPEGKLLLFFGEPGTSPENINLPTDVVIDYENVRFFEKYKDPKFDLDYVVLVPSQFGPNKVNAYGVGKMQGMDYSLSKRTEGD